MSAEASISTRLVKGSDLAVGKPVRVVAEGHTFHGKEGKVRSIVIWEDSSPFTHLVFCEGNRAAWLSPAELEPAERAE